MRLIRRGFSRTAFALLAGVVFGLPTCINQLPPETIDCLLNCRP